MKKKMYTETNLLAEPMVFADFCNGYFFDGKHPIKKEDLRKTNIKPVYFWDEKNNMCYAERDVAMDVYEDDEVIATIALENKSDYDERMIEEMFYKDGVNYLTQGIAPNYGDKDHLVISVVMNYTNKAVSEDDFYKFFNIEKQNENIQKLFSYSTNYKLNVFNIVDMKKEDFKKYGNNDLRVFLESVYYSFQKDATLESLISHLCTINSHLYYPHALYEAIKSVTKFDFYQLEEYFRDYVNSHSIYKYPSKLIENFEKNVTEKVTKDNVRRAIRGFIIASNVSNEVIKKIYPNYTDEMIDDIRKNIKKD